MGPINARLHFAAQRISAAGALLIRPPRHKHKVTSPGTRIHLQQSHRKLAVDVASPKMIPVSHIGTSTMRFSESRTRPAGRVCRRERMLNNDRKGKFHRLHRFPHFPHFFQANFRYDMRRIMLEYDGVVWIGKRRINRGGKRCGWGQVIGLERKGARRQ